MKLGKEIQQKGVQIALQSNMEILEEAHAYLHLYCQNVFSDDFCLLLQWNHTVVEWTRNILPAKENSFWEGDSDALEKGISFILWQEKGFFEREKITKLFQMLEKLRIKPFPQLKSGEGRDGEIMELTLGTSYTRSTFYWHNCRTEPEWVDLDEIADFLWNLNKTLQEEDKTVFEFSILSESKKQR